jgi:hypothetical protein
MGHSVATAQHTTARPPFCPLSKTLPTAPAECYWKTSRQLTHTQEIHRNASSRRRGRRSSILGRFWVQNPLRMRQSVRETNWTFDRKEVSGTRPLYSTVLSRESAWRNTVASAIGSCWLTPISGPQSPDTGTGEQKRSSCTTIWTRKINSWWIDCGRA